MPVSIPITASLGLVTIAVTGPDPLAAAVAHDLDLPPAEGHAQVALEMSFPGVDTPLPGTRLEATRMLRASFERDAHPVLHVKGALPLSHAWLPDPLYRFVHPAHLTRAGYGAQLVSYQLFDGAAQLANLSAGQSFLHASALERDGRRVAIVARGGMGKTGTLLQLVSSGGWRYLSDDWTVVESSGVVHRSHKPVQVFPRNLTQLPRGEALLLAGRTAGDRFSWWVRKRLGRARGMRRKVTAAELFGDDQMGSAGPLSEVLLVRRGDVGQIVEQDVDAAELAGQAAVMVAEELAPSLRLLGPHLGELSGGTWISTDQVHAATEGVLARVVAECERLEVRVPDAMPEPEIERYLVDRLSQGP